LVVLAESMIGRAEGAAIEPIIAAVSELEPETTAGPRAA
jgi:hypothetical protein